MNVLTDEQLEKMQDIMDNPSPFARAFGATIRARREQEAERRRENPDTWFPGPDSWRPGMPVPERFRQERQTGRFPRPQ